MRKIASLLSVLMLLCALAYGQTRTITGTVRNDKGEIIPAATITEEGTKNAVKADLNGFFSIKIKDGSNIVITAAGHDPKTITPVSGAQNVTLTPNGQMTEVVVTTAIGIKRRPKELGYANTTLKNDQITVGKSPTIGQALSGKIAGLTVYNTSNSVNASPRIVLRGNRSINQNNQALIVLDGVPVPQNTINYLNPNDIESVTTLKGGQAATLYGSDGVNGVIVINTKKGGGKPQVSFTHSSNFEQVAYLPKFQTTHGSGSGYGATLEENYRPFENQQYGDPYDGSIRSAGRILQDGTWQEYPYQFIPGIRKKVWDMGYTMQNDISVSGGDANSSFYFSFQDANTKGIVPQDEYRRDAIRFNASRTYGKFKAAIDATYTIDRAQRTTADFYFFALNTPGWIPIDKLKDWETNPFANPNGYFNDYYNNPWFELENNRNETKNNYFNGNLTLSFKPLSWLDFNYRLGVATTNSFGKSWTNRFDYSEFAKGNLGPKPTTHDPQYNDYSYVYRARNAPIVGGVSDGATWGQRLNSDFLITLAKDFGDWSGKLILGNNIQTRSGKSLSVGSTSVVIPNIFNVSNRAGELTGSESNDQIRKIGNYADLTIGYKDYIFVHGSFRQDLSSIFYADGRESSLYTYPYYGADVSLVLTDAVPSIKSDVLNFLKLRGGWNYNGNDNLAAYSLDVKYGPGGGFPFGSTVGTTQGNTIPDPDLKPEFISTIEGGFEAQLWKNRINLDVTAYKQTSNNQILPISISSSTGMLTYLRNAAKIDNYGVEVEARVNILKKKDWSIDVNANYTYNKNKVKELYGGLSQFQLNSNGNNAFIFAQLDKPFPYLQVTAWDREPATGSVIVDPVDGWPVRSSELTGMGTTVPTDQLGVGFRASFKNFTLAANAEYRGGYVVYHDIGEDMAFTGSSAATTIYNREQFIWPNSVFWDGTKYVPNTSIPVENYIAIYQGWGDLSFTRGIIGIGEFFTSSGAFWKVRDASLTYTFGERIVRSLKVVKGASLSIFGRNLYTWLPKDNWYTDPEFSNTNGNGIGINNSFNTPPVRQFGATLNVTF